MAQACGQKIDIALSLLYSHGSGAVGRLTPRLSRFIPSHGLTAAMAAHDSAGASSSALAETGMTRPSGQAVFGPCLHEQMDSAALIAALNAWGSARDRELEALRADLATTKAVVEMTFDQAQAGVSATLLNIIEAFRAEAGGMQQQANHEAQQSLARLEHVVSEARTRFDQQDARFAAGLGELAQRLQVVDAWAQAEPARVAAMMQAAPAAARTSPAGPALPPVPITPPGVGRLGSPGHACGGAGASVWAAYAAGRAAEGPAPPDAWAPGLVPPGVPGQWPPAAAPHQHFNIATPAGFGGGGGKGDGKGGGYPRDLRSLQYYIYPLRPSASFATALPNPPVRALLQHSLKPPNPPVRALLFAHFGIIFTPAVSNESCPFVSSSAPNLARWCKMRAWSLELGLVPQSCLVPHVRTGVPNPAWCPQCGLMPRVWAPRTPSQRVSLL